MFPLPAHLAPFAPRGRQEVLLGIRPEDLTIAPHETPGSLAGEVALVEHIGSESLIAVRPKHAETAHVAEEEDQEQTGVMATTPGYSELKVGDPVAVGITLANAVLFSPSTGERLKAA